jgi:dye decolorizing peroxidase
MRDGTNDVGLLFAAYTRDPRASYLPMQRRVAQSDAFNRWNTTIGSAAYLLPGGVEPGGILAAGAFS